MPHNAPNVKYDRSPVPAIGSCWVVLLVVVVVVVLWFVGEVAGVASLPAGTSIRTQYTFEMAFIK